MITPLSFEELRAAVWAARAARRAKRSLRTASLDAALASTPPVPALPDGAKRGVLAALWMRRDRCLVRAIVTQRWEAAHGSPRDLIIGVKTPGADFEAHAWLDGDPGEPAADFSEITRVRASSPR